jgi:hypothetical protein
MKNKESIKYPLRYISIAILASCFMLLASQPSYASTVSLGLSPSILQVKAVAPADIRAPVTIENKSNEPIDVQIGLKLFKDSGKQNGEIQYLGVNDTGSGPDKNIFQKIQIIDNARTVTSVELGPKQKKNLYLRIVLPKGEHEADYYFSVVFIGIPASESNLSLPKNEDKDNLTITQAGIAMNVLLSIGKQSLPQGYIDQFSSPFYFDSGPVPFVLKVSNTGSHYLTAKGIVLIKNMFGQTVGKIEIPSINILANGSRFVSVNTNHADPVNSVNDPNKLWWPEHFLLGFYSAELSLALSDQGPLFERTIHFMAFPVKFILGLLFIIIVGIGFYIRIKMKVKEVS